MSSTPSRVSRMRRNIGNVVTFNSPVNGGIRKVVVKNVRRTNAGEYVLVGRDVTNIAQKGSPWRSFSIKNMVAPVKYSSTNV